MITPAKGRRAPSSETEDAIFLCVLGIVARQAFLCGLIKNPGGKYQNLIKPKLKPFVDMSVVQEVKMKSLVAKRPKAIREIELFERFKPTEPPKLFKLKRERQRDMPNNGCSED